MTHPKLKVLALSAALLALSQYAYGQSGGKPQSHGQPMKVLADNQQTTPRAAASKQSGAVKSDKTAVYEGPAVLDPANFFGGAAMGYAAAKGAPQVMAHLFCYCGCDATDHHHHLIDCFTSNHGVDCHICQEEAILGFRLHKEGLSMAQIQKEIDDKYSSDYPFQEATENLKQYNASRLYKPATATASNASAAGEKAATAPKLKPGFHVGDCCKDDK